VNHPVYNYIIVYKIMVDPTNGQTMFEKMDHQLNIYIGKTEPTIKFEEKKWYKVVIKTDGDKTDITMAKELSEPIFLFSIKGFQVGS